MRQKIDVNAHLFGKESNRKKAEEETNGYMHAKHQYYAWPLSLEVSCSLALFSIQITTLYISYPKCSIKTTEHYLLSL